MIDDNENEEDNEFDEQEENDNNGNDSRNQMKDQAKNQAKNQVKNQAREAAKKAGKAVAKAVQEGMKKLFTSLLANPYFWLVVLALFIIIVVIYLLGQISSKTHADSVDKYINNMPDSEQKASFEAKKSLIYFSLDEINKIYDSFVNDDEGDKETIEDMKKKFKDGNVGNDGIPLVAGAVSVNEKREIYKHILLTEKYNFNNIKWTEYNHDGTIKDAELKVDNNMGMQYPNDASRTLDSFVTMTMPYLQSWYIPLAMYSGSGISSNLTENEETLRNAEFAYQIIAKAYSNISINKYNKQTYQKVTDRYEYNYTTYTYWETTDEYGNVTASGYNQSSGTGTKGEALVSEKTDTSSEYALVEAKTFDIVEKNEYEYIPYDVSNQPDFEEEPDEPYNETVYSGKSYTVKTGKRFIRTRVWNDKLLPINQSLKSTYTVADIEQSLGGTMDASSKEYYKQYETTQKLDKIDFINANPDIFKKYIKDSDKYDDNVAFTKPYLVFAYDILLGFLKDIGKDSGGYPYIYGQSLGIVGLNFSLYGGGNMWDSSGNLLIDPSISVILPFDKKYKPAIRGNVISYSPIVYGYPGHTGVDISPNHSEFSDESKFFTSIKYSDISKNPFVKGPAVYSPCDGTIVAVQYSEYNKFHSTGYSSNIKLYAGSEYTGLGTGGTVVIDTLNGVVVLTHLFPNKTFFDSLGSRIGTEIKKGEMVGNMGNTGNSEGPHLHYEVAPLSGRIWQKNGAHTMTMIQLGLAADVSYVPANSNVTGTVKLKDGVNASDLPPLIRSFHTNLMKYSGYIEKYSKASSISTLWIIANIAAESNFNPNASNGDGGQGLMQLEWGGAGNYGSQGFTKEELRDPETNIKFGVEHFAAAYKSGNNSIYEAMGIYNRGGGGFRTMKKGVNFTGTVSNIEQLNFVYSKDKYPEIPQKRQDYYDAYAKYYYVK